MLSSSSPPATCSAALMIQTSSHSSGVEGDRSQSTKNRVKFLRRIFTPNYVGFFDSKSMTRNERGKLTNSACIEWIAHDKKCARPALGQGLMEFSLDQRNWWAAI